MAVSCASTVTVLDIPNKIVRVSADISVDAGPTHTVVLENADVSSVPKQAEAANIIWNKFLVMYAGQLAEEGIAAEMSALETQLKNNIEGRTP
jgi:hypothetical protein